MPAIIAPFSRSVPSPPACAGVPALEHEPHRDVVGEVEPDAQVIEDRHPGKARLPICPLHRGHRNGESRTPFRPGTHAGTRSTASSVGV